MIAEDRQQLLSKLGQVHAYCAQINAGVQHAQALEGNYHQSMSQLVAAREHHDSTTVSARSSATVSVLLLALGAFYLVVSVLVTGEVLTAGLLLLVGFLSYRAELAGWPKKNLLLVAGGLLSLMVLWSLVRAILEVNVVSKVVIILGAAAATLIALKVNGRMASSHAAQIDQDNQDIAAHNQQLVSYAQGLGGRYSEVVADIRQARDSLQRYADGWYPPDYLSLDAAEFFISSMRNLKADTMKEAVLLFDTAGYRRAMLEANERLIAGQEQLLSGQQQILGQLKVANVLNVAQLATQVVTAQRIGTLSQEVRNVNTALATPRQVNVRFK